MIDPSRPRCACGYDLTGLNGPPWKCPECGGATVRWPPPIGPLAMTRREAMARRWSLIAIGLCPVLAPWTGGLVGVSLLVIAAMAVLVFAGTLSHWLVRGERGAARLFAVLPFLAVAACGLVVVAVLLGLSALVQTL
jgi:hypothetical protein